MKLELIEEFDNNLIALTLFAVLTALLLSPNSLAYAKTDIKGKEVTTDNVYVSGEIGIGTGTPAGLFQVMGGSATFDQIGINVNNPDNVLDIQGGDLDMNSKGILNLNTITASGDLRITGGALNLSTNRILDIGSTGTDFTSSGGLTLADSLIVNDGGISLNTGDMDMNGNQINNTNNLYFDYNSGDAYIVQNNYTASQGGIFKFQARDTGGTKQLLFKMDPSELNSYENLNMNGEDLTSLGNTTVSGDMGLMGGNIGIGTTSPNNKLDVSAPDTYGSWDSSADINTTDGCDGDNSTAYTCPYGSPGSCVDVKENTTGYFNRTVTCEVGNTSISGNVGIGTTNPGNKLDINTGGTDSGISFGGGEALTGTTSNGWLRLNQNNDFSNGVYTPGYFRADGGGEFRGNLDMNGNNIINQGNRDRGLAWDQVYFTSGNDGVSCASGEVLFRGDFGDDDTSCGEAEFGRSQDINTMNVNSVAGGCHAPVHAMCVPIEDKT